MTRRLRPLTGLDALFLYLEAMGTPMHVASLIRLDPPARRSAGFGAVLCRHLASRLQPLPILRRVLAEAPLALGHPVWRELEAFDPTRHLVRQRLPAPGSERQLAAKVARLHAQPLDRAFPLWRVVVIEGLADGSVALYLQSHHALVDGQAGVQVTSALLDAEPRPPARTSRKTVAAPAQLPARDAIARAALRASARQFSGMLRGVPAAARQLAASARGGDMLTRLRESVWLAPRTPFNAQLGPARRFATCSLPLAAVKAIGRRSGASLNDVVMAICSGALREHLLARDQLPKQSLVAAMPVSLRAPGVEGGNEVSMVQCPLATDLDDPRARLQAIRAATGQIKGRVDAFRGLLPTDFPGIAAPIWATGLGRLWQRGRLSERLPALANLVISNVPGPPIPLFVAGVRVRHFHPVSIITHGLGLNITLLSYDGSLEFGLVSAPETLDRPDRLAAALPRALEALDSDA